MRFTGTRESPPRSPCAAPQCLVTDTPRARMIEGYCTRKSGWGDGCVAEIDPTPDDSWSELIGVQQGCQRVYGQVPGSCITDVKTARPDTWDVGFLVWQLGGDTCFMLPILTLPCRRVSVIMENCSRTILINPGAERSLRSVANCEAIGQCHSVNAKRLIWNSFS